MPARTSRLQLPFAAAALFTVTLLLGPPGKSASPEDFHANIVNGRLTAGFPAAGALLLGDDPATAVTWCSGVLIGCETFLTAAHCVCDTNGAGCQGARAPSPLGRLVYLQHAGFFRAASIRVHPDYQFPRADLAVIKLTTPVTGIAPAPLALTPPAPGVTGTIVGFGRSGGSATDVGLKRSGVITTAPCTDGISDGTAICWNFTGAGSNSCNGDSGGPLFVDSGFGTVVAGVATGGGQYGYCQFLFPVPGTWHMLVARVTGSGPYQLTATVFGGDPPVCGNGLRETGEDCDGDDDGACPGACNGACACGLPCTEGGLLPLRVRLGRPFLAQAMLLNPSGTYDRLDPRTTDFSVTVDDGGAPVEITIPAGDAGWVRSTTRDGAYRWTGRVNGARGVILKCRRMHSRNWRITVKGADGTEALRRGR